MLEWKDQNKTADKSDNKTRRDRLKDSGYGRETWKTGSSNRNKTGYSKITQPTRLEPKNTPTASLLRSKTSPQNEWRWCEIKPYDGEAPALKIWRILSTSSLPLLPDSHWRLPRHRLHHCREIRPPYRIWH